MGKATQKGSFTCKHICKVKERERESERQKEKGREGKTERTCFALQKEHLSNLDIKLES